MIRIHQIKCEPGHFPGAEDIAKKLHCLPSEVEHFEIERESIDARHGEVTMIYTVLAKVRSEERYMHLRDVQRGFRYAYSLKEAVSDERPVVAGFGPAGMSAALILAESGLRPIVIERGKSVEERAVDVQRFFEHGILDPASNVQYGEGGAGTFSDGKLTTRIKDPRVHKLLEEFVEAGADKAILYQAMPHLGTDKLQQIVRNIRQKIVRLGGEVRFSCTLEHLLTENGRLRGAVTDQGIIPCRHLVLCLGHSAADTYRNLFSQNIAMEQKDFAAGVRVEHPQEMIDRNQYGIYAGHPALGAAPYRLTHRASDGRGVYSFCMCPGGIVIPASTEDGALVVNGMSYAARDGRNANSAILVQVHTADFDRGHPLDGFIFQQELETRAYREGFRAPSQNIADYLHHQATDTLCIPSSYPLGNVPEEMHALFPAAIGTALEEGFRAFDKQIPGFIDRGIMVGMESRSSSPVRLRRTETGESVSLAGLYPCGEGAGYAGGIVSSGVDGIKQAENVIEDILNGQ
ncbi:MAG: hypothetical protein IKF51_08130 [Solobacterium sp.]|nr:hypothetical protein [Solobacterium sp.]